MITQYKELTQVAFADRVSEINAIVAASSGNAQNALDSLFNSGRKLYADDLPAIKSILLPEPKGADLNRVGVPKLQRCLDIYRERIEFAVLNNVPLPIPMSVKMKNEIERHQEFLVRDYDSAIADKIIMVLTNSENLSAKIVAEDTIVTDSETSLEQSLQREQTAEEEVLQEE